LKKLLEQEQNKRGYPESLPDRPFINWGVYQRFDVIIIVGYVGEDIVSGICGHF
jgi:hypothetical protein